MSRRKISIWLMQTEQDPDGRFVLSAKAKRRAGFFRKTGWSNGIETHWRPYPLRPQDHTGFIKIGYL